MMSTAKRSLIELLSETLYKLAPNSGSPIELRYGDLNPTQVLVTYGRSLLFADLGLAHITATRKTAAGPMVTIEKGSESAALITEDTQLEAFRKIVRENIVFHMESDVRRGVLVAMRGATFKACVDALESMMKR